MKSFFSIFPLLLFVCVSPVLAAVEPNYDPSKPPVSNAWFDYQGVAEQKADIEFIKGMRPHHAGALTMSTEYLNHSDASNYGLRQLAKGIIHNQKFEIGMLDRVEELVGKKLKDDREWRQIAEKGLAQKQRFVRMPMPGPWTKRDGIVTVRDVEFAKAMVVHHEGALVMCKEYLADDAATNKYLRLLCVDILADQKQEIDFMNDVVSMYPGNPDDIKIDASMIHGMEGMNHGHSGASAPKKSVPKHSGHGMDHGAMEHKGH